MLQRTAAVLINYFWFFPHFVLSLCRWPFRGCFSVRFGSALRIPVETEALLTLTKRHSALPKSFSNQLFDNVFEVTARKQTERHDCHTGPSQPFSHRPVYFRRVCWLFPLQRQYHWLITKEASLLPHTDTADRRKYHVLSVSKQKNTSPPFPTPTPVLPAVTVSNRDRKCGRWRGVQLPESIHVVRNRSARELHVRATADWGVRVTLQHLAARHTSVTLSKKKAEGSNKMTVNLMGWKGSRGKDIGDKLTCGRLGVGGRGRRKQIDWRAIFRMTMTKITFEKNKNKTEPKHAGTWFFIFLSRCLCYAWSNWWPFA